MAFDPRRLVPTVIRKRYAVKFGIALLVLGMSVGAIGFVATGQIESEVRDSTLDEHANIAAQEAEKLLQWHERNKLATSMVARSEQVQSGDPGRIGNYIATVQADLPDAVYSVHYVDTADGEVINSTEARFESAALSDVGEPWGSAVEDADSDVQSTDVFELESRGDAAVAYYTQARGSQSDRVIVITMRVNGYASNLQNVGSAGGAASLVVDRNGTIAFDANRQLALRNYGDADLVDAAFAAGPNDPGAREMPAGSASVLSDWDLLSADEEYVVGYAQVRGTDWVVLTHRSTDEAYGFVTTVSEYGTLATLGGVLLIGLVGAVLGRNTATAIDRLTSKTERMEEGNLDVDFETKRIDNIGRLYDGFAEMQSSLKAQIEASQRAREEAEQARERTQRLNRHLESKADEYSEVMQAAADGDLTRRMDPESDDEAMTEIAEEFNEMIARIEATVDEVTAFAGEVATASEEVTASSEEVRNASEQVTESIQEISDGAERQNDRLQSVSGEMSDLSTTVEQIAASSNEVADIAERTALRGREGREAAREAIDGMNEIEAESARAVEEIEALEAEMEQIDELVDRITAIAKETNMLALNANIEASRGTGGEQEDAAEGFSVVAGEVKDLAEETKDAAEEIEERLNSIREQTERTAAEVQNTSDQVSEHADSVENAVDALEEIAGYAQETNTGVQEISAATEQQAASTQQVVAMVDEATTISEETTAEAENVAAAAEEQTTALTEVSQSASDLAGQASRLSEALDRFDTDAEDADAALGLAADEPPTDPSEGDDGSTDHAEFDFDGAADIAAGPDQEDDASSETGSDSAEETPSPDEG
ncbi:methyl-accepting chemotaxis protein [Halostella salina]|uniref:methyl-accepting chemotaxis protein n=1 Tax=Halostella salina TaxID=1547897 RepID=UPI000EF76085|nr:methyl-accepting chemotaxis protein [Halostella salina]